MDLIMAKSSGDVVDKCGNSLLHFIAAAAKDINHSGLRCYVEVLRKVTAKWPTLVEVQNGHEDTPLLTFLIELPAEIFQNTADFASILDIVELLSSPRSLAMDNYHGHRALHALVLKLSQVTFSKSVFPLILQLIDKMKSCGLDVQDYDGCTALNLFMEKVVQRFTRNAIISNDEDKRSIPASMDHRLSAETSREESEEDSEEDAFQKFMEEITDTDKHSLKGNKKPKVYEQLTDSETLEVINEAVLHLVMALSTPENVDKFNKDLQTPLYWVLLCDNSSLQQQITTFLLHNGATEIDINEKNRKYEM